MACDTLMRNVTYGQPCGRASGAGPQAESARARARLSSSWGVGREATGWRTPSRRTWPSCHVLVYTVANVTKAVSTPTTEYCSTPRVLLRTNSPSAMLQRGRQQKGTMCGCDSCFVTTASFSNTPPAAAVSSGGEHMSTCRVRGAPVRLAGPGVRRRAAARAPGRWSCSCTARRWTTPRTRCTRWSSRCPPSGAARRRRRPREAQRGAARGATRLRAP